MIVVVGLAFEARVAAGPGIQVMCSGNGQGLAAALNRAVRGGCQGLISFGVAGGLAPGLRPGACVVGSAILSAKSRLPTDHSWSQKLLNTIPGAIYGPLFGVPAPVADPAAKQALHNRTGAVAVDMESHVVA